MNPRPLGYEPYDARLKRLAWSLVAALTSAYGATHVFADSVGLPRLKPSRCVSCTNPCTNLVPDLLVSSLLDSSHPPAPGTPSGLLAYVCAGLVEDQSTASATSTPAASRPEHRKPRSVRGRGGASADEDTLIQAGVRLPQGTSALLLSHAPMERVPGTATVRPHRRLCIKRHSHARANISGSESSSPSVHLVFRVSTPHWCSFSFSGSGKR